MVELRQMTQKHFMTKSGIGGVDFAANPYVGCSHGCLYCYAKTMDRRMDESLWGSVVYVKDIESYVIPKNTGEKHLMLSSITDPYQGIEATEKKTRRILEEIVESNLHVSILTKSPLVLRDLDLFRQMKHLEIGFSLSMSDKDAIIFEPGAPTVSSRIEALHKLHAEQIRTHVFFAPIIPYYENVIKLLEQIKDDVDYVMFDRLNIKSTSQQQLLMETIRHIHPELLDQFYLAIQPKSHYFQELKRNIIAYCEQHHIHIQSIF